MKMRSGLVTLVLIATATLVRADNGSHQMDPSFATGFVTPHELSFTVTRIGLWGVDGSSWDVWPPHDKSGNPTGVSGAPITFKRSDTAFQPLDLADIEVPEGRYIGLNLMFENMTAKLDGGTYVGVGLDTTQDGTNQTIGLAEGTRLCSNGTASDKSEITTANQDGAVTAIAAADWTGSCAPAAHTITSVWPGGGAGSYFSKVYCFSGDGSLCQPGDEVINASTPTPSITILMDLYHSLQVITYRDPTDSTKFMGTVSFAAAYPMPLMGRPGAAIHLEGRDQGSVADASLIFSGDGKIQAVQLNSKSSRHHFLNARNGFAMVTVKTAPEGFTVPPNGMAFIADLSLADSGTLKFPLTAETMSRGLITLAGFHAPVGSDVSIACDDVNELAGFTWDPQPSGMNHCTGMGTTQGGDYVGYTVRRIVDPPVNGTTVLSHNGCANVSNTSTDTCVHDDVTGVTTFGAEADGFR